MKKSEQYRLAQLSILRDDRLSHEEKLEIVKTRMDNESMEKFCEEREEAAE